MTTYCFFFFSFFTNDKMSFAINRYNLQINSSSPITFPNASPTPKLFSTPSKKIPENQPWQDVPQLIDYTKRVLLQEQQDLYYRHTPDSLISSPSPFQEQIIGSPYIKEPIHDPIIERSNPPPPSKFTSFFSKIKKVASGK